MKVYENRSTQTQRGKQHHWTLASFQNIEPKMPLKKKNQRFRQGLIEVWGFQLHLEGVLPSRIGLASDLAIGHAVRRHSLQTFNCCQVLVQGHHVKRCLVHIEALLVDLHHGFVPQRPSHENLSRLLHTAGARGHVPEIESGARPQA